ncbi:hypothetical protein [Streptomyces sp. NPDC056817]|uniref:LexA family protein n=1 Tax=Streptomyces sp. NPDC056817 TaxID=3345950 RepID=UPI00367EC09E
MPQRKAQARGPRRWIEERGEGPSVRQLAKAIGMRSTASVTYHLANLERSGALIREGVSV